MCLECMGGRGREAYLICISIICYRAGTVLVVAIGMVSTYTSCPSTMHGWLLPALEKSRFGNL